MARTLFLFIGLKSASERSSAKYESKKDVRDYLMRLSLLRQWGIYENSEMQDFSLFRKQQHSQCIFWEYLAYLPLSIADIYFMVVGYI
jgi:hypothetical protein